MVWFNTDKQGNVYVDDTKYKPLMTCECARIGMKAMEMDAWTLLNAMYLLCTKDIRWTGISYPSHDLTKEA
jgi:hypothetical protein